MYKKVNSGKFYSPPFQVWQDTRLLLNMFLNRSSGENYLEETEVSKFIAELDLTIQNNERNLLQNFVSHVIG